MLPCPLPPARGRIDIQVVDHGWRTEKARRNAGTYTLHSPLRGQADIRGSRAVAEKLLDQVTALSLSPARS